MRLFTPLLLAALPLSAGEFLTSDNNPLGTLEEPLILRTFMPDPGLGADVFAHHGTGANSPKYTPKTGEDVPGEYTPVKGIPAAIAVNHGPALSYCFDTTECRLMYAWQGGFLDMYPYWGDSARGNRQSFNYVPHLVGNLFYMTKGKHPVMLMGKCLSDYETPPQFLGYALRGNRPVFRFKVGETVIRYEVRPSTKERTFSIHLESDGLPPETLLFQAPDPISSHATHTVGEVTVILKGPTVATFQGFPRNTKIKEASAAAGEMLYQSYGCLACHSTDGSKGHGPTFDGLHGSERKIAGAEAAVRADEAYILESMKDPNAKTVDGFPPNYMPPYQLKDLEYESLLLFIKSLNDEPE